MKPAPLSVRQKKIYKRGKKWPNKREKGRVGWNGKKDGRRTVVMTDIEALVPRDRLLRKIEKVMDYDWLYERLSPYYKENVGRPGIDPVVLIKMALLEHLYGIRSLRQTYRDIQVNVAYRWSLGYDLLETIPHFATVSYAFCKRSPAELRDLRAYPEQGVEQQDGRSGDGIHRRDAHQGIGQQEEVPEGAGGESGEAYVRQLREEADAERAALGKKPIEEDDDQGPSGGGTVGKTVSTTDPDCGMFVKRTVSSPMRHIRRVTGGDPYRRRDPRQYRLGHGIRTSGGTCPAGRVYHDGLRLQDALDHEEDSG